MVATLTTELADALYRLNPWWDKAVHNAPFGLLVTQREVDCKIDPRIVALPLSSLMLLC